MDEKTRQNLIHDINAIFTITIDRMNADRKWVDVELKEDVEVTACDFPHLLTIANGYNVSVNIYPLKSNQLGVFFREER